MQKGDSRNGKAVRARSELTCEIGSVAGLSVANMMRRPEGATGTVLGAIGNRVKFRHGARSTTLRSRLAARFGSKVVCSGTIYDP